jgi:alpha-D-ribose 1-methylphosphonate 5-triphosphate diphosphatase
MTETTILANARLILPDSVATGHVVLRGGRIAEIGTGTGVPAGAIDCEGDYLCPGLIELHTDNLERHISPRPQVDWPHHAAIAAHDAELAGVGISTVFDAVRAGSILRSGRTDLNRYARAMATEILGMRRLGALRISHLLHLRAETCSETLLEELAEFGPDDGIGIVSLMDHTPGQRQFGDLAKFAAYVQGRTGMDETAFRAYCAYLEGLYDRLGPAHEAATVAAARRFGAVLASHDDTTAEQVAASVAHGVRLAEFPTTVEAARACRSHGVAVIMGAPNLVRGGSHSGNVAAADLADQGLLDILSSDYVPASLLMGAVMLGQRWGDMARGIATVTAAPAAAAGLDDRGRILPGLRADLLRFRLVGQVPVTAGLWVAGRRVA